MNISNIILRIRKTRPPPGIRRLRIARNTVRATIRQELRPGDAGTEFSCGLDPPLKRGSDEFLGGLGLLLLGRGLLFFRLALAFL